MYHDKTTNSTQKGTCVNRSVAPSINEKRFQISTEFLAKLKKAYEQIIGRMGDALEDGVLVGPLHSKQSVKKYHDTVEQIKKAGGRIEFGGRVFK